MTVDARKPTLGVPVLTRRVVLRYSDGMHQIQGLWTSSHLPDTLTVNDEAGQPHVATLRDANDRYVLFGIPTIPFTKGAPDADLHV